MWKEVTNVTGNAFFSHEQYLLGNIDIAVDARRIVATFTGMGAAAVDNRNHREWRRLIPYGKKILPDSH